MKQLDAVREQGLRAALREAADKLRTALPRAEQLRGIVERGQSIALEFEDVALALVTRPGPTSPVKPLLVTYQHAVNAYWIAAENADITKAIAAQWRAKFRKQNHLSFEDVDTEATFLMRRIVVLHALSDEALPLHIFAYRRLFDGLARFLGQESGVPVAKRDQPGSARSAGKWDEVPRRELLTADEEPEYESDRSQLSPSPEDELLAAESASGMSGFDIARERRGE